MDAEPFGKPSPVVGCIVIALIALGVVIGVLAVKVGGEKKCHAQGCLMRRDLRKVWVCEDH